MGWLGPDALAAGALATNLYFAFLIFGIGLVTRDRAADRAANSARKRHSVRDVRRTRAPGHLGRGRDRGADLGVLWNGEPILLLLGQEPALAARGGALSAHAAMGASCPSLGFVVLRCFVSALRAAGLGLVGRALGAAAQCAARLRAHVRRASASRRSGSPAPGSRPPSSSLFMFVGLALVIVSTARFRRYRLFGRFWRPTGSASARSGGSGCRSAARSCFEVRLFNAAAFLMGLIGAEALAAHAIALQIASLSFMVPLGLAQAGDGAGRPRLRRRRRRRRRPRRLDGLRARRRLHGRASPLLMVAFPRALVGVFLDAGDPENAGVIALAVTLPRSSPPCSRWSTAPGGRRRACCAASTTPACRCSMRRSATGASARRSASLSPSRPASRAPASGSGSRPGSPSSPSLMLWRWSRRAELGLLAEADAAGASRRRRRASGQPARTFPERIPLCSWTAVRPMSKSARAATPRRIAHATTAVLRARHRRAFALLGRRATRPS